MESAKRINDLMNLEVRRHGQRVWRPYMEKYSIDAIAELGVDKGSHFKLLIEHGPKLAVAVDAWIDDGVISRNDCRRSQKTHNRIYDSFKKEMEDKPFVKICRGYTFDVVKEFPDKFFDLVYVDADHTKDACRRDLADWWPKVKPGGTFCGHDYIELTTRKTGVKFGVIQVVSEFAEANNLKVIALPEYVWAIIKPGG